MALTVEQLRSYDSNWANLVVQQDASGTQVKGGGIKHALASLFRTDAAQARNKATYTAIRNAIMQDDRFFAPEVKAKADELLKGLDNGSVIRASTIKDIIRQLDEMSTPEKQKAALTKTAVGHLAALGVPGNVPASVRAKYKELAADFVVSSAAPGVDLGSVKVDKSVAEFNRLMHGLFRSVGSGAEAQEIFCATLNNYTPRDDGAVSLGSPADRLQGLADTVKDNLRELDEIGNSRGDALRRSFSATLKRTGGLPHGTLTELANKGAALPKCELDFFYDRSSADAIHRAVSKMADAMDKARGKLSGSLMKGLDPDEAGACLVKAAVDRLPQNAKRNLLAALRSNDGMNLLGYYEQNGANPKAQRMKLVYSSLLTHLSAELDGADPGATVRPPNVDAATLPSNALSDFATDMDAFFMGRATQQIKNALMEGSGLNKVPDPLAEFKGRMNAIAKGAISATIFTGIDSLRAEKPPEPLKTGERKKPGKVKERIGPPDLDKPDAQVANDFVRYIATTPDYIRIRLKDGTSVTPKTAEEAGDALAKFVSGNPDVTFAQLTDTKLKTKVRLLMCCLQQASSSDLARSVGLALDSDGVNVPFAITKGQTSEEQKYTLSMDENGAITFVSHMRQTSFQLVSYNIPSMPLGAYGADDESFWDVSMEVTLPADSFNKLAAADWSKLDTADLHKAEDSGTPHAVERFQEMVAEDFRFSLEANVSFSFHADTIKSLSTM